MFVRAASLILIVSTGLFCAPNLFGQSPTTGGIAGTVRDPKGAVIVRADVTVISDATAQTRKVTTDDLGNYNVPFLPPGTYQMSVTANGFRSTVIDHVGVTITETNSQDIQLEIVTVDFGIVQIAPPTQTDGAQMGRVVDSRAVAELPLATRNYTQILALSSGTSVALPDNTAVGRNSQNVSVNGARVTQNNFQINGVDANKLDTNSNAFVAAPAPETIQEFKVQTSLYDATFGRAGGGNVQIVTRSGSNDLHGAAYEYFRNDALNANNPFLKGFGVERPVLQRNVFGGMIGGPIKRNKIFFFGSYQGARERNGASDNSLSSDISIVAGLTDDRSASTLLARFRPTKNGQAVTSIDPAALALLNAKLSSGQFVIPTPQADGSYSGSAISTYREDQFNSNFDFRMSEKNWLAVKIFFSNAPQFFALNAANVPGFGSDQTLNNRVISVQDVHSLSQRTINEARIGYNFIRQDTFGRNPVRDSDFGITRVNATDYPGLGQIRIGSGNAISIGNAGAADSQLQNSSITLVDILSTTRGRHSIRTGAEIIVYRVNVTTNSNRRGQINFGSFNNFLIGSATNSTLGEGIHNRILRTADYSFFLQDDWKLSQKLMLNLGLRYELDLPPYETRGLLSTFDPALYQPRLDSAGNPIGPPIGGFVQAGNVVTRYDLASVPNVDKRVVRSVDPDNFAPRIGFAYSPLESGRIVLRGGYGIYYSRPSANYIRVTDNTPPLFALSRSPAGTSVPLANPYFALPASNQFPAFVEGVNLAGNFFDRSLRSAYFNQYNGGFQYALSPHMLLEAVYVGTHGVNLIRNVRINQAALASLQHPINNQTTNTPANAALRAPYQGVEQVGFQQIQSTAQSSYNSLQVSLTRRLSRGLQLLASYTLAKSIDNSSGISASTGDAVDGSPGRGNQFDSRANRGPSDFDRTHRFVLSYLWDLPHPAVGDKSAAGRLLLRHWQVAGVITAMSGLPIDITDSNASFYFGPNANVSRPNWAASATRSSAMSNIPTGYYFNPFVFVRPVVLAGQPIPSSGGNAIAAAAGADFGNVGRNVLRGPAQNNVDFSIVKRFSISESKSLEFHAEFFNLLNHVNFANPLSNFNAVPSTLSDGSSNISSTGQIVTDPGDFGRITATSNNPRLIQFAVKVNF